MIRPVVFMETHGLLEVVRKQPGRVAVRGLLKLAERGELRLVVPAFCLAESHFNIVRFERAWRKQGGDIRELAQKQMSSTYRLGFIRNMHIILGSALGIASSEKLALDSLASRLFGAARLVPLDVVTLADARRLGGLTRLAWPDAIVLACVLRGADGFRATVPKAFVTGDAHSGAPAVQGLLRKHGCTLIGDYRDALRFARRAT